MAGFNGLQSPVCSDNIHQKGNAHHELSISNPRCLLQAPTLYCREKVKMALLIWTVPPRLLLALVVLIVLALMNYVAAFNW